MRESHPDHHVFPAVFDYAKDGISVSFPDLPGCLTCGNTEEEAFFMAKEALELHVWAMEQEGIAVPCATPAACLVLKQTQRLMLIETWMPPVRNALANRAVKKTLTIPKWLDDLGKQKQVNFSRLLQESLKKHLGILNQTK